MHIHYRHGKDLLDERDSELAVNHHKQDTHAPFAGDDKVCLHITHSHSSVDMPWSFVDKGSVVGRRGTSSVVGLLSFSFVSMRLNPSAIDAFDEAIHAVFRYGWQMLFMFFDASSDIRR